LLPGRGPVRGAGRDPPGPAAAPGGPGRGPGRAAAGGRWAGGAWAAVGASENDTGTGAAGAAGAGAAGPAGAGGAAAGAAAAAVRLPFCPSTELGAAAGRAGAFLASAGLGASAENASLSLRTTGASMVEDADRTNSPMSLSLSMTALLSTPNSLASSYTRTFATALLTRSGSSRTLVAGPGSACAGRPSDWAVHRRVLIRRSSRSYPAFPALLLLSLLFLPLPGQAGPRQACPGLTTHLGQELPERAGGQWSRQAQCPRERPAPLRLLEAFPAEMQVGAPARQLRTGIRDDGAVSAHHTQQIGFGRTDPAPDTRPDRRHGHGRQGPSGHSGRKLTAPGHRPCRRVQLERRRSAPVFPAAAGSATWVSGRISIFQPVSRCASRAFWPSFPIASDSW